ncbi:MAG: hypothetical protein K8S99_06625 [Planctomycetes bacterium]|nr:hypothetical protein [Planctomycetota bacterium]
MGITVRGPYSGNPVKVRDQDAGRAVKDEEGRIFYVLPRSDGLGYYGAMTRAGGTKDEARAMAFESKEAVRVGNVHEQVEAVHDARGKRSSPRGKLLVIAMAVVVVALIYIFKFSPYKITPASWTKPPPPNAITADPPAAPATPNAP